MNRMNQSIKARWVARLRELPNSMQGKHALKSQDGKMCCLGVLTEMAVEEGVIHAGVLDETESRFNYFDEGGGGYAWHGVLPKKVRDWASLDSADPWLDQSGTASHHNDALGSNFDDIAGLIEENL